jgi:hypothetical protein
MKSVLVVAALAATSLGLAFEGQPALIADFTFAPGQPTVSGAFGTDALDEEGTDSQPEIVGTICNNFAGGRRIADLKCWFEDKNGNPVTAAQGGCPITGITTTSSARSSGHQSASHACTSGAAATFDLASPIHASSCVQYTMQVVAFTDPPPTNVHLKMQASSEKAAKHFDILGSANLQLSQSVATFDVQRESVRSGVVVTVVNADPIAILSGVRITLITNASHTITGASIDDQDDEPIAGATVQVASDGLSVDITNLSIAGNGYASVWVDLSDAYAADTAFRVRAMY